ncbi:hypothetical protein K3495_g9767 [Podosphaera aphanis]|nr:hypothetical protein K3495_g9767 [Podosphaera aphanis]
MGGVQYLSMLETNPLLSLQFVARPVLTAVGIKSLPGLVWPALKMDLEISSEVILGKGREVLATALLASRSKIALALGRLS